MNVLEALHWKVYWSEGVLLNYLDLLNKKIREYIYSRFQPDIYISSVKWLVPLLISRVSWTTLLEKEQQLTSCLCNVQQISHSRHWHHTYTILYFKNNKFLTWSDSFSSLFKLNHVWSIIKWNFCPQVKVNIMPCTFKQYFYFLFF